MKDVVHSSPNSKIPVLVDAAGAIGLVALILGALLALAVAVVPAAEPSLPEAQRVAPSSVETAAPTIAPAAPQAEMTSDAGDSFVVRSDTSLVLALEVGNRMYPEWHEAHRVRLHEEFWLGDTENSAIVTELMPDFRIIDGVPRSLSSKLANPAVRVFVRHEGAAIDSSWAFLNFPPHFSPRSFYTFQLKEIAGYPQSAAADPAPAAVPDDTTKMVKRSIPEPE